MKHAQELKNIKDVMNKQRLQMVEELRQLLAVFPVPEQKPLEKNLNALTDLIVKPDHEAAENVNSILLRIWETCFNFPKEHSYYLILLLKAAEWCFLFGDEDQAFKFYYRAFEVAETLQPDENYALQLTLNGDTWKEENQRYEFMDIQRKCYQHAFHLSIDPIKELMRLGKWMGVLYDFTSNVSCGFDGLSKEENEKEFAPLTKELENTQQEFANLILKLTPEDIEKINYDVVFESAKKCFLNLSAIKSLDVNTKFLPLLDFHFNYFVNMAFQFCKTPDSNFELNLQMLKLLVQEDDLENKENPTLKNILDILNIIIINERAKRVEVSNDIQALSIICIPKNPLLAMELNVRAIELCPISDKKDLYQAAFITESCITKIKQGKFDFNELNKFLEILISLQLVAVNNNLSLIQNISNLIILLTKIKQNEAAKKLFEFISPAVVSSKEVRVQIKLMKFAAMQGYSESILMEYDNALAKALHQVSTLAEEVKDVAELALDELLEIICQMKFDFFPQAAAVVLLQRQVEKRSSLGPMMMSSLPAIKILCNNLLIRMNASNFQLAEFLPEVNLLFNIMLPYLVTKKKSNAQFDRIKTIITTFVILFSKIEGPWQASYKKLIENKKFSLSPEFLTALILVLRKVNSLVPNNALITETKADENLIVKFTEFQIEENNMEVDDSNIKKRRVDENENQVEEPELKKEKSKKTNFKLKFNQKEQQEPNQPSGSFEETKMVEECEDFQKKQNTPDSTGQMLTDLKFDPNAYEAEMNSDKKEESDDDEGYISMQKENQETIPKKEQETSVEMLEETLETTSEEGKKFC